MNLRILLRTTLLLSVSFLTNCSEESFTQKKEIPQYIPFPVQSVKPLSPDDLKHIDLKKFARVEPGEFLMGSPENEPGRSVTKSMLATGIEDDEAQHKVRITRLFFISKFETTNREWNQRFGDALRKEVFFSLPQKALEIGKSIVELDEENNLPLKNLLSDLKSETKDLPPILNKFKEHITKPGESTFVNCQELGAFVGLLSKSREKKIEIGNISAGELQVIIKSLNTLLREKRNLPVTDISYSQAVSFCSNKTAWAHENGFLPDGLIYRLPTEAEWEYACRAGNLGVTGLGDGENLSGMNANINGGRAGNLIGRADYLINRKKLISIDSSKPKFEPNSWGIHDMHGNIMEWCYDFYGYYSKDKISVDPIGPIRGTKRVLRGGSFLRPAQSARSAARESLEPSWRGSEIGFRVVLGYPLR